ncbi:MAG: hypothetical protein ACRD0P_14245, partial [Stackebrandtia sp.]
MESPTHHLDTIDPNPIESADDDSEATPKLWRGSHTWMLTCIGAGALTALILIGYGAWWLITTIANAVTSWVTAATDAGRPLAETIADPVRQLITDQADHFPVSANTLWWALVATTVSLFILAVLGSHGARIGWAAIGGITTALVWIAHAPDSRVLAAAITAGIWAVLAVFAFNRFTTPEPSPKVVIFRPEQR